MQPDPRFLKLPKEFWANVRLISQQVGYTESAPASSPSSKSKSASKARPIKVPRPEEIREAFLAEDLSPQHLFTPQQNLNSFGQLVIDYFVFRANTINRFVKAQLMNRAEAQVEFEKLRIKHQSLCPLPLNKQKRKKKSFAFFTGIVNMLIEANLDGLPCDYDPRELTTITKNSQPFRTLARRVDGAFPSPVNPIAIWEIKEYYYTTTFGSRVADGVYESLLDGLELEELRQQGIDVQHLLMIDDYFTWWECGRSYLCRIIDILHMGYVDEVLFGREVLTRLPAVVRKWVRLERRRLRNKA